MPSTWYWIAGAIVFDGAAGLAGGVLPERMLDRWRGFLIAFAAGTLLVAAFVDILPEALELQGPRALWWAAGAFMLVAIAEWTISRHVHRRGGTPAIVSPQTLLGSDALHNIGDGIAIAAAFIVSIPLGVVTSLAVIIHEVPEEVGDYVLLRSSGVTKRRALIALAGVQGTAAIGAVGTMLASQATNHLAGIALSIASGTFLFIAATDLLPEVLREGASERERVESLLGFLLGAAVVALVAAL